MKKALFGLMLLVASPVFAMDLSGDLSGAYRVSGSDNNKSYQYDIVVVKTDLKADGSTYYTVSGNVGKMNTIGLSIQKRDNGRSYIHWFRLASPNSSAEGTRLDGEFNMILGNEGDALSLGGDFEEYEIAKMTKLPHLSK